MTGKGTLRGRVTARYGKGKKTKALVRLPDLDDDFMPVKKVPKIASLVASVSLEGSSSRESSVPKSPIPQPTEPEPLDAQTETSQVDLAPSTPSVAKVVPYKPLVSQFTPSKLSITRVTPSKSATTNITPSKSHAAKFVPSTPSVVRSSLQPVLRTPNQIQTSPIKRIQSSARRKSYGTSLGERTRPAVVGDESILSTIDDTELRVIGWNDVCLEGDKIEKIAEASYAEVYRVTTQDGISIIKAIRLESPIKPQTTMQKRSGLVDEQPHLETDLIGELRISEWLADIPGFVVYKERYIVKGKAPKALLETHQAFQRKCKRQDSARLQFYPSPSRYLDDTRFLVVELGDAGLALEDFKLKTEDQLWDTFFLVAIALARAEEMVLFEHRDLHEGNVCLRQAHKPKVKEPHVQHKFGFSGLDITILDYGLSRAEDPDCQPDEEVAVAYDLERDLSIFTSTHAEQCAVYRQMRSFLLMGQREWLPPERHNVPYEVGVEGPICWDDYAPYTNVLWLAYIYKYMTAHFAGDQGQLASFTQATDEMWQYLDPDAEQGAPCFGSAEDIVRFAVEAGWILPDQLLGTDGSTLIELDEPEMERKVVAEDKAVVAVAAAAATDKVVPVRKSQRQCKTAQYAE
ncbi:hypothetical protein TD95_002617 [Thielaviopsis punctulata]|uniref:non-specific serine/threonine protein kinase n=1 Tax=Thielaviopsis punctulata TaxID=72032 RepID=A0A0F4ZM40_9PEZI|nr:hypothetical protein TD95_002617 [Thielaviopsis punctulata]